MLVVDPARYNVRLFRNIRVSCDINSVVLCFKPPGVEEPGSHGAGVLFDDSIC